MAAGELQACANEGLANGLSTVGDRLQIMPGQVSFGRDLNSPDPKEAVSASKGQERRLPIIVIMAGRFERGSAERRMRSGAHRVEDPVPIERHNPVQILHTAGANSDLTPGLREGAA